MCQLSFELLIYLALALLFIALTATLCGSEYTQLDTLYGNAQRNASAAFNATVLAVSGEHVYVPV